MEEVKAKNDPGFFHYYPVNTQIYKRKKKTDADDDTSENIDNHQ